MAAGLLYLAHDRSLVLFLTVGSVWNRGAGNRFNRRGNGFVVDFVRIPKPHKGRNPNPICNRFINGKRGFGGDRFKHFRWCWRSNGKQSSRGSLAIGLGMAGGHLDHIFAPGRPRRSVLLHLERVAAGHVPQLGDGKSGGLPGISPTFDALQL